jgi:hypothetical protein
MMDQPSAAEIVTAVREFIDRHAIPQLSGRTAFHARVASNALAIVLRELELGPAAAARETASLTRLLGQSGTLEELNRELCKRIRSGQIDPLDPALQAHLITTTLSKVEIDQPNYSGFVHSHHRSA